VSIDEQNNSEEYSSRINENSTDNQPSTSSYGQQENNTNICIYLFSFWTMSFTDFLNLTVNEKHCRSHRDNSQISIHSDTIDGPIIFDDEIIDSREQKVKNI